MNFKRDKSVRLDDWNSERSFSEQQFSTADGLERGSEGIKIMKNSLRFHPPSDQPTKELGNRKRILDPQGSFLQTWNKIFVVSCVIAVSLDPLFFYIPVIDGQKKCLNLDKKLEITACVLRSFIDIFYILHILFQFRTGYIDPSSRVFGRGELIEDPYAIAKRYLSLHFIVDVLSVLPLPQVLVLLIIPKTTGPVSLRTKDFLEFVILSQYVPRFFRIYPLYKEVTRTSGIFTEMAWAGAAFNLFIYMLASHKYLQSITVRVEEMRIKRQDAEQWMSHRMLPESLREQIRRYEQYKWQENRGVEEESLIRNLPKDIRRDIKRHLCWDLLTRVPMFGKMDDQLLDAMCDCLKPILYTEKSFIVSEGDPVDEMLFVMRGSLLTMTTNGGRTGFFNSVYLKAGDFCGEELLTWALDPNSSSSLPTSTRTVKAVTDVEAFALTADDLKFVASQFRRLHSKQLRHTFRKVLE
ncbi:hypothetical protein F0562_014989 [Nyssa sinensis]|uniref:Cyclic nucleotide-binding domain-containing protein n=1 Tax=Nyssa sinensis TaxID=561372 RepID=A0A5J4ZRT2_9ASTE|nr:hypothetical protein F0562_014989 [Nyssa sinensis]